MVGGPTRTMNGVYDGTRMWMVMTIVMATMKEDDDERSKSIHEIIKILLLDEGAMESDFLYSNGNPVTKREKKISSR